jgi:hypothetical protein
MTGEEASNAWGVGQGSLKNQDAAVFHAGPRGSMAGTFASAMKVNPEGQQWPSELGRGQGAH